jgi:anti-sigma B factor antagonist
MPGERGTKKRLQCSRETVGEWTLLQLEGELEVDNAPELRAILVEEMERNRLILLDLGRVLYIDSTGLGIMVGVMKHLHRIGGELRLICGQPRILKVFEVTGLDKVFTIYPTSVSAGELRQPA